MGTAAAPLLALLLTPAVSGLAAPLELGGPDRPATRYEALLVRPDAGEVEVPADPPPTAPARAAAGRLHSV